MDYEWLKKLQINSSDINFTIYENFISLTNNIKNKDKNINVTLRMVAESLLQYLNNRYAFIDKDTKPFLNNILADFKCISVLQTQYHTVAGNCYTWLKGIQKNGNNSVHGNMKIFDKEDVKNKFLFLIDFAYQIFKKNYKDVILELNKDIYLKEYEKCYNNETEKTSNTKIINDKNESLKSFNEKDILEKIKLLNSELEEKYKKVNYDNEKFINKENIENFKNIINCVIEIVLNDLKCKDVSELKTKQYSEIYEIYKFLCIDNIDLSEKELIINVLKSSAFEIRRIINVKYGFKVLEWITKQREKTNIRELSYYEKIAQKLDEVLSKKDKRCDSDFYYIESQVPFFVNDQKYYQVNIRKAVNVTSKSSNKIMFSKEKLLDDYASKITFSTEIIEILGRKNKIFVIHNCEVAIRPCELSEIVNLILIKDVSYTRNSVEYRIIMDFLQSNRCNLLDIILDNDKFINFKNILYKYVDRNEFVEAMTVAKEIIENQKPGHNILRYLIANLESKFLSKQRNYRYRNYNKEYDIPNKFLSNLNISLGADKFDKAPYTFSLSFHTPSYKKLIKCIDPNLYYESVFARKVRDISIKKQTLFVDKDELGYENVKSCIDAYNFYIEKINLHDYKKHTLDLFENKYVYNCGEVEKIRFILNKLEKCAYYNKENDQIYKEMQEFIKGKETLNKYQTKALEEGFKKSNILILNGEAGSGKTELICNYLTDFFAKNRSILYVANTNSVVNSMEKRVKECLKERFDNNLHKFRTIAELTYMKNVQVDVVFFDECKSINNNDIYEIFSTNKANLKFTYAVFVGDVGQIPAVGLGNWFNVACDKLEKYELKNQHRTNNEKLINIWQKVRNYDKSVIKELFDEKYIEEISNDIYTKMSEDEVVLCLNYGGLYGVNGNNSCFQNDNPNEEYIIKENIYKINDPIVFNEVANHKSYKDVIYNNLKGIIKEITEDNEYIFFTIGIERYITEDDVEGISNIEYVAYDRLSKRTLLCLKISKGRSLINYEINQIEQLVPFNVNYGTSIHKAQGLQYDSVKIIITPESEEIINNEIFYTAITRAKKYLKIYIINENVKEKLNIIFEKDNVQDVKFFEQPQINKKIENDDVVVLKDIEKNIKNVVKIRNITSEPERGIISPNTKLAQELLGKKEGDKILWFNLDDKDDLKQYEYVIYNIIKEKDV